jgi:hypothetical protein
MVSLAKFVRSAPPAALRDYFRQENISIPGAIDWSASGSRFVQPLVNAVENMDEIRRSHIRNDAERISNLSDEAGQAALYSVVTQRESLDLLENGSTRALYVFLHDSEAFRRAEEVRYTDSHRRGRMWDGYIAKSGLSLERGTRSVDNFKNEIRQRFRTENVHVDIFDRTRGGTSGEAYKLIQVTVYREGRLDDVLEFVKSELTRRPTRPVIEAALTYEPSTGVIEVVANVQDSRKDFVDIFARTLLNYRTDKKRLALRRYDLAVLTRPHAFPSDPEDGIESVSVNLLRLMPLNAAGERVTLECERDGSNTIWQMASSNFGLSNPLHGGWIVTKAKLLICFRPTLDSRRGKVLPLTITTPHGCDLKERTECERIVGEKYLRRWGILKNG